MTLIHWFEPDWLPRDFSLRSYRDLPLRIVTLDNSVFAAVPAPARGWSWEDLIAVSVRYSEALAGVEADCMLGDVAIGVVEHPAH